MSDIKIKNIKPKIQYKSDGQTLTYSFPFVVFKVENIKVYFDDKEQTDGYSVSLNDDYSGSITFEFAPSKDTIITIIRYMNIERISDFQVGGAIRAEELNHELDYQIACTQQISDDLSRSMILPPYIIDDDIDFTMPLPDAGKCIVWSEDGKSIENSKIEVNSLLKEVENKTNIVIEKTNIVEKNTNTVNELTKTCIDIEKNINPSNLAKSDLSNTGYISNCILEAPNGILELSEDTTKIIVKQGLKVLIANGLTEDGKILNVEYTVPENIILTPVLSEDSTPITYFIMIDLNGQIHISTSPICEEVENYTIIGKYISYDSEIQKILARDIFKIKNIESMGNLTAINEYENQDGKSLNLDNYMEQGVYNFSNAGNITNIPTGTQGTLVVLGNINILKQIWYNSENESETYTRTLKKDDDNWSSWIKNLTYSSDDKSIISGLSMPSERYVDLTYSNEINYTAPANGYFYLRGTGGNDSSFVAICLGTEASSSEYMTVKTGKENTLCVVMPVVKGNIVTPSHSGITITNWRFYYAEGEE